MFQRKAILMVANAIFGLAGAVVGVGVSQSEKVVAWWNKPPAPYSAEATRVINGLTTGDNWSIAQKLPEECHRESKACLERDKTRIVLRTWHADIYLGEMKINDSFTAAESAAIQRAGEHCWALLQRKALGSAK